MKTLESAQLLWFLDYVTAFAMMVRKVISQKSGGAGGIRTLGTVKSRTTV
jgi:hypothetical protein